MVLVGSKPSFQTGGAKAQPCQPALLHFLNSNGKKFPSEYITEKYYWVEPVTLNADTPQVKAMLSNNNLRDRLDLDFSAKSLEGMIAGANVKLPAFNEHESEDAPKYNEADSPISFIDSNRCEIVMPKKEKNAAVDIPPTPKSPINSIDTTRYPRDVVAARKISESTSQGTFSVPAGATLRLLSVSGKAGMAEYGGRKIIVQLSDVKEVGEEPTVTSTPAPEVPKFGHLVLYVTIPGGIFYNYKAFLIPSDIVEFSHKLTTYEKLNREDPQQRRCFEYSYDGSSGGPLHFNQVPVGNYKCLIIMDNTTFNDTQIPVMLAVLKPFFDEGSSRTSAKIVGQVAVTIIPDKTVKTSCGVPAVMRYGKE